MKYVYIVTVSGGEWEDKYQLDLGAFSTYDKAYKAAVKFAGGKSKLEFLANYKTIKSFKTKETGCYREDEFLDIDKWPIDTELQEEE